MKILRDRSIDGNERPWAMGARGIGEIGLTGVASALASATYLATGVRVRNLPIRIEDLLSSTAVV